MSISTSISQHFNYSLSQRPTELYYQATLVSHQTNKMKQKVVIRLSLNGNDQKCRTKAFKIAVSQFGVESAAITGEGKNQLEVVGEIDAANLTSLLRKNLGQADLVSVGPAGGDKKPAAAAAAAAVVTPSEPVSYYYTYPGYQYPVYQVTDSYGQSNCSIM